jgi:hypothetical protein
MVKILPWTCFSVLPFCPLFAGIVVAIHSLVQTQTVAFMQCNIYGRMDASNLRLLGFSRKPPRRPQGVAQSSSNRTFIPSATKRIAAGGLPNASRPTPSKDKDRAGARWSSSATVDGLYVVLDYCPHPGTSYFFTFSIGGGLNALSMERTDPMQIDTAGPECCALLPVGGACVCGTTSGTLMQWNVR